MAYTNLADIRLASKLSDTVVYTDALLTEGISWATSIIDEFTGTSFESKAHTVTVDGNDTDRVWVDVADLISVTSATVDAVAVASVAGWVVRPGGIVTRDTGIFTSAVQGRNVVIVLAAGATTTVPADIELAARQLSRWYVLKLVSEAPDNAIQVTTAAGDFRINAMPGKYGPTSLPEVNAVLLRRMSRPPAVG